MRIWVKQWKKNRILDSVVYEDCGDDTRTHKVLAALEYACRCMDLAQPIWLDAVVRDFQRYGRCRFTQDAFVEEIGFDYLEMHVLEED